MTEENNKQETIFNRLLSLEGYFCLVLLTNLITIIGLFMALANSKNFTADLIVQTGFSIMMVMIVFITIEFLIYGLPFFIKRSYIVIRKFV